MAGTARLLRLRLAQPLEYHRDAQRVVGLEHHLLAPVRVEQVVAIETHRLAIGSIGGNIVQKFDDSKPSIPVPSTSSRWGSLASFGAHRWPGTKRYYGTSGNSFVAMVEFGPKARARAITAGGESGHPDAPHFNDEAERYTTGTCARCISGPNN